MANALTASYLGGGLSSSLLQKITVMQKFDNHVLVMLDYTLQNKAQYTVPAENTPVRFQWGVSPLGVRTSYGYVNHYETVTPEVGSPFTRIFVLGTSKPMNSANPTSWADTTRSAIVKDIARRHRLRSIVHTHNVVAPSWMTGPRTDFQALSALAEEAGYRFWVDGSTVFFVDPTRALNSASTNTAVMFGNSQIRKFKMVGGSNVPGANRQSTHSLVYGIANNGEVIEARAGNRGNPSRIVPSVVGSFGEAADLTSANARLEDEYYVAEVVVTGNANVYPGVVINLEQGRVTRDQGGYWLVTEATHEATAGEFTTKITAVRGQNRSLNQRSTVRGAAAFNEAVVRNGETWESVLQEHINV